MILERCSGILLHPTSLPGKYGIGTLGREAFEFADFLFETGQKLWQILPLGHTGFGNSPYQCYSSIAGNPLLINLELLKEQHLLKSDDFTQLENQIFGSNIVDFNKVYEYKMPLLNKAFLTFKSTETSPEYKKFTVFCKENEEWLADYAFFMALKESSGDTAWYEWTEELRNRDLKILKQYKTILKEKIEFYMFVQYAFFTQWESLKTYCNKKGIKIIGDIPLYVSYDSVDVWAHPEYFSLDKEKSPILVAGVPPDYFSETGQLWGNPCFNWDNLAKDDFIWWVNRVKFNLQLTDIIRIDHFRGLEAYWAIPAGEKTAINGKWLKAPGKELFECLQKKLEKLPVIAEDLGVMTPEVELLRDEFNFPGMKILQFAFDSREENNYLPHTFGKNCIVYTGTHDNNTVKGWFDNTTKENQETAMNYLNCSTFDISWSMVRTAWASVANVAIIPIQDLLELGESARMNIPGTTKGNWAWKLDNELINEDVKEFLKTLTKIYFR